MASAAVGPVRSAWRDWTEWRDVFVALFGPEGENCPCVPNRNHESDVIDPQVDQWRHAARLLETWSLRTGSDGMPPRVLATLEILQAIIADHDHATSNTQRRLAYSMATVRAVNFVVDPLQTQAYAQSILNLASHAGLPRWLVDVRHAATHQQELPSLELLRVAADTIIQWLFTNYWEAQALKLADSFKGASKVGRESRQRIEKLARTISTLDTEPDYDEIDDLVDSVTKDVPARFVESEIVPALASALAECNVKLVNKKDSSKFLLWERILAGLSDSSSSDLTGALVLELCSIVVEPSHAVSLAPNSTKSKTVMAQDKAAETRKEFALWWLSYLLSKRWHGLSDDSIVEINHEGRSLMDMHPNHWSRTDLETMLSPAPANRQDRVGLLPLLREAMLQADTWSQKLVGALMPAVVGNTFQEKESAVLRAVSLLRLKFGKAAPSLSHASDAYAELPSLEELEELLIDGNISAQNRLKNSSPSMQESQDNESDSISDRTKPSGVDTHIYNPNEEAKALQDSQIEDILERARKRARAQ